MKKKKGGINNHFNSHGNIGFIYLSDHYCVPEFI